MKNEVKKPPPLGVVLGQGHFSVGPGFLPGKEPGTVIPAIMISRVVRSPVLFGLDGKPLDTARDPENLVAIIGTANRQAVQIILKTCMTLLEIFEKLELEKGQPLDSLINPPPQEPPGGPDGQESKQP